MLEKVITKIKVTSFIFYAGYINLLIDSYKKSFKVFQRALIKLWFRYCPKFTLEDKGKEIELCLTPTFIFLC